MTTSLSLESDKSNQLSGENPAGKRGVNWPLIGKVLFKIFLVSVGLLIGGIFGSVASLFWGLAQMTC
jgi:hypothetical protein